MGWTGYSQDSRATRARALDYSAASHTDARVFKQNALKRVNEGMDPSQISWRESRDSSLHPATVPIILQLDVTGSMGAIPADLCKGDLPKLMGHLIEGECPDAAILFVAVGDLFSDEAPMQIGQFESGDAELDHWLTTCWLEGNGGGNGGESYSLSWLFAANMVGTDAWDKRGQKGLIISVGDEPLHHQMPVASLKDVFRDNYAKLVEGLEPTHGEISASSALAKASERWNVHHIQLGETRDKHRGSWDLLGEGYHEICRSCSVVDKIREIITAHMAVNKSRTPAEVGAAGEKETEKEAPVADAPKPHSIPAPL